MASNFTPEMEQYMRSNAWGKSNAELTEMINTEFGTALAVKQVKAFKNRKHIPSGLDGRYKPGHVPYSKGKKRSEYASAEGITKSQKTEFKQGHTPHNKCQVGDLRVTTEGYLKRKMAEPNIWMHEHIRVWREHNGEIPEGNMIIFLDGDRMNCDISNLAMVTLRENGVLNKCHLRTSDGKLTETAIYTARLKIAVDEKKKHKKEKEK